MELIQFLVVGNLIGEPKGSPTPPPFHLREPKGSPHTPSVPRYAFCTGLLRLVHLVHLATLGERSAEADQSVPRRASEASLYKGQIIK